MTEERSEYIYRRAEDGLVHRGWLAAPARITRCMDCAQDVSYEFFVIHNDLWEQAVGDHRLGWICVPCLERRLGRQLTREDFKLCPANVTTFRKTQRVLDRMGGRPLDHMDLL